MARQHILCGLLVACLAAMAGCPGPGDLPAKGPSTSRATTEPDDGRHIQTGRHFDAQKRFSVIPPAGHIAYGSRGGSFMTFEGEFEDGLTVNLMVNAQHDDGTSIDRAGPTVRSLLSLWLADYRMQEAGFVTIDGKQAYYCSGTFRWGKVPCRNIQFFIRGSNGLIFILTYACIQETFAAHRGQFERSAMSVRAD